MSTFGTEPFFSCPSCGQFVEEWLPGPGGRPSASCPHCWSLERHRLLALVLRNLDLYVRGSQVVLEYAPQRQVRDLLIDQVGRSRYVGIDLMDERFIDCRTDACALPFRDGCVDVMVQFHVLEHIPDDLAAMREMHRVLRPGGIAIVQVPQRLGRPTDEDLDTTPEERTRRFGQADHVRYYGDDFDDRLRASGFTVDAYRGDQLVGVGDQLRYNIPGNQPLWILRRFD